MPVFTSEILKRVLVWLLLLAIVDSAVLYISDMALETEEVELVETDKSESDKSEKETESENEKEDSKISPYFVQHITFLNQTKAYLERPFTYPNDYFDLSSPPPEFV